MKILAICGSTREESSTEIILQDIIKRYGDRADIRIYDSIADLPHFNQDHDNQNLPSETEHFRNEIKKADGILICTPEYIFSLPGVLKNALEWTVSTTLLVDKPTAFIVASSLGEKAFEELKLILTTVQAHITDESGLLIPGVRAKLADGRISDGETLQKVDLLMNNFFTMIEKEPV